MHRPAGQRGEARELRDDLQDLGLVDAHVDENVIEAAARGLLQDSLGVAHRLAAHHPGCDQPAGQIIALWRAGRRVRDPEIRQWPGLLLVLPHS